MPGFLTLTTPLLLAGLALLALPLIAHWLHRRSRRTLVFPSIALLVQTAAQQSQFHRIQRWLLLALRLLAVACIVLAFTRPVWQSTAAGAVATDDAAVAVVIVLDTSLSTAQSAEGVQELATLKATAGRLLDELLPGHDTAGIILADAAPRSVFPRLTANVAGLRAELQRLEPTAERADIAAAFAVAGSLLATHAGPKRLYVLSDLQRSNWTELLTDNQFAAALPAGTLVSVGARTGDAPNVSLSRPHCFPPFPLTGEPFDVTVHVANYAPATRQVRIQCERTAGDGSERVLGRDEQTVTLAAGERRDVSFLVAALELERQFVRFESLVEDSLAADNHAWLVVETNARTPVLLLSDDDPQVSGTAAYYLLRALAPSASAPTRFEPQHLRTRDLTREALAAAPVVVVGYLADLSESQAGLLAEYVHGGGGLVWFAGEGPVDRQWQTLTTAPGAPGLLPWAPGPRRVAGARTPRHLGGGRWQSRWLRAFDEQSQLALQEIQFARVWSAGAVSPGAEVLLSFEDGSPAVGVRAAGSGIVAVCNFSPDATTSDLARHGAFVAFTQLLVQGVLPQSAQQSQPLVGQPWIGRSRLRAGDAAEWSAVGPGGEPVVLAIRPAGEESAPALARTSRPGIYRLLRQGTIAEAVAVASDEREGDLARIPAPELEQRLSAGGTAVASAAAEASGITPPLRGRPLWGEFLSVAMAAIAVELFLLGWWRR